MTHSAPSSVVPGLPAGIAHQPQRPLPPAPFLLDPEIASVMDRLRDYLVDLLPGIGPGHEFDESTLWEISWRLREISLVLEVPPLSSEEGADLMVAWAWWKTDCESGDEVTRRWSELAA